MHLPSLFPLLLLLFPFSTFAADSPPAPAFDHELEDPAIDSTALLDNDGTPDPTLEPTPTPTELIPSDSPPSPTPNSNTDDTNTTEDPLKIPICAAFDTLASACGLSYPPLHNGIFSTGDNSWTDGHGGGECVCKNDGVIRSCKEALQNYFVKNGEEDGVDIRGRVKWLSTGLQHCQELKKSESSVSGPTATVDAEEDEEETWGVSVSGRRSTRTRFSMTLETGGGKGRNGTITYASGKSKSTSGSISTRRRSRSGSLSDFDDEHDDISPTDTEYDPAALPTDAAETANDENNPNNTNPNEKGVKVITVTVPPTSSSSSSSDNSTNIGEQKSEQQLADEAWQADFLTTLGIVVLLCIVAGVSCMCGIKREHMRRDGELVNFWKEEEFPWED